jgi:ABC-type antimicrobial peptide transport system, permease component
MNYANLLLSLRILYKNKVFALINVLGLSIGIATFLVLTRYVEYEYSYNKFFPEADRVYRVDYYEYQNNELLRKTARTHTRLALVVKDEISDIEAATKIYNENCLVFNNKAKFADQKVYWADSAFFSVFRIRLIRGNPSEALKAPNSTVISKSQAAVYFGNEDPMGKIIYFNEHLPFTVTGVFEDLPQNSTLKFNFLNSWSTLVHYHWTSAQGDFQYPWAFTFVRIAAHGNAAPEVDNKLKAFVRKNIDNANNKSITGEYRLHPITELHFSTNLKEEVEHGQSKPLLWAIVSIAIFILITAWVNFVNLSLAKSFERAGEIGVRKVYGAGLLQISRQYISESLLLTLFTFLIGYSLYEIMAVSMQSMGNGVFVLASGQSWFLWLYALIILGGTFLSTVYPAMVMSRVKPSLILKHRFKNKNNVLTNSLVVFQFVLSTTLIGCSLIAFRQISYIRKYDIGFDTARTLSLRGPASANSDSLRLQRFRAFRDEVVQTGYFTVGTASMNIPGQEPRFHNENVRLAGADNQRKQSFSVSWIDEGYAQTFGLKLLAGRDLVINEPNNFCLINETAAKTLGFNNPSDAVNTEFLTDSASKVTIVGVIRDFHNESLKKSIEPFIFYNRHPFEFGYYSFRLNKGHENKALSALRQIWEKHFPNDPFVYYFMDDFFARQYDSDNLFSRILGMFSILSIIIAALGLFGLASFSIVKRTKEIGVRKANGARIVDLLLLLVKDYAKLVGIAMMVAIPLIYILMNSWLNGYVYRTRLMVWDVLFPLILIFSITLITLSYHVLKTAKANPVVALRDE